MESPDGFGMNELQLSEHADGVVLPVRARAGARSNGITGVHAGALKVSVTQAAERGKANAAIAGVLAKELGVAKLQISILSGETISQKRLLIQGVTVSELSRAIAAKMAND